MLNMPSLFLKMDDPMPDPPDPEPEEEDDGKK